MMFRYGLWSAIHVFTVNALWFAIELSTVIELQKKEELLTGLEMVIAGNRRDESIHLYIFFIECRQAFLIDWKMQGFGQRCISHGEICG